MAADRHFEFGPESKILYGILLILITVSYICNLTQLSHMVPELEAFEENSRWRPAAMLK